MDAANLLKPALARESCSVLELQLSMNTESILKRTGR